MEEAVVDVVRAVVLVVDESIEQAGGAGLREDVVVGDGGGDEGAVSLSEPDLVAGGADADGAVALDAHGDDEAVVLTQVVMEGLGDLHHVDIEVRGVDNSCGAVGGLRIVHAVAGLDMVVEGLGGELGMELARLAVHSRAVVVEDAIGDVTGLLDLGEEDAATDGVDAAGREIEHVAGLHLMVGKDLGDGAVGNPTIVLLGGYLLAEAGIEMGAFLGLDDIPHL